MSVTIIRQVEEMYDGKPQVEIELDDGPRQYCTLDDADWAIQESVQLGFDPQWVKGQLESEEWEEYDEFVHVKRIYLGTVFALCPSGKYYTAWANSNVKRCHLCNGEGSVANIHHDPKLFEFWQQTDRDIRQNVINTFGFFHGNGWPTETIDILEKTQAFVDLYRDKIICPQCVGLGSSEAYLDQIWWEKAEKLYDQFGYSIESGEGDPCDIFAEIYEDYDQEEGSDE